MNYIDIFLEALSAEKGRSQKTLESYGTDLHQAQDALGDLKTASADALAAYLAGLPDRATTIARKASALRGFYKFLMLEKIISENPAVALEVPKAHKSLPKYLTMDEIDRLLDAVDDIKYKAMFATMYSSGMRVSEVIHLHYDDISRTNMQIHVRDTKNRMDRYTILSKRCLDILTQYWFEKGRPRGILFPNKFTGNYLTVNTLEQVMRRAVSDAGLPKNATPHSLRHSFATHLMEQGVERQNIQALLGHRDPKSTEVYLHVSNKSLMGIQSPFDRKEGADYE